MTHNSSVRLFSGAPYWLLRSGLRAAEYTPVPPRVDVVIVGAGITGALLADRFVREGLHVLVLERDAPAEGSTAVSTALLQYELDVELNKLSHTLGEARAARAYQRCAHAIDELGDIARSLDDDADFASARSLYVGNRRGDAKGLRSECKMRRKHGLDSELLSTHELRDCFGIQGRAALVTSHAASADPIRLTRALLVRAVSGGAVLCARTPLESWSEENAGVTAVTPRGSCRARAIVFATGYEVPRELSADVVSLHSSYALVTQPCERLGPLENGVMIWETARPYTYLRATADGRILIGGCDIPFRNPDARDALLPVRTRKLERQLAALFGDDAPATAFAWAGTFGETADGLPRIGRMPAYSHAFAALGYGGNGIVFSQIAAGLLADLLTGRPNADELLFGFDR